MLSSSSACALNDAKRKYDGNGCIIYIWGVSQPCPRKAVGAKRLDAKCQIPDVEARPSRRHPNLQLPGTMEVPAPWNSHDVEIVNDVKQSLLLRKDHSTKGRRQRRRQQGRVFDGRTLPVRGALGACGYRTAAANATIGLYTVLQYSGNVGKLRCVGPSSFLRCAHRGRSDELEETRLGLSFSVADLRWQPPARRWSQLGMSRSQKK